MTEKAKKPATKIFDVSKPGKSAPSASGKPIIITNRPVLQDPMMVDDSVAAATVPSAPAVPSTKIKIQPIHSEMQSDSIDVNGSLVIVNEPKPKKKSAGKSPKTTPIDLSAPDIAFAAMPLDEAEEAEPTEAGATSAEAEAVMPAVVPAKTNVEPTTKSEPVTSIPDTSAAPETPDDIEKEGGAGETKPTNESNQPTTADASEATDETGNSTKPIAATKADEVVARKQAERSVELEKLAESHQYYLPINQVEKRKNKQYTLVGIIVIIFLAAAWADISLDAGIIHISGVKPLTHFFSK